MFGHGRGQSGKAWQQLCGAVGLLLALLAFRLGGKPLGAAEVMCVVGVYGFVIALAVVMESVRRMAIERLRRGWRAQPWVPAVTLLVLAWWVVWFLFLRPGV